MIGQNNNFENSDTDEMFQEEMAKQAKSMINFELTSRNTGTKSIRTG